MLAIIELSKSADFAGVVVRDDGVVAPPPATNVFLIFGVVLVVLLLEVPAISGR